MYNSIYPTYVKSYLGINNQQIKRKQDDEKSSQSSKQAENSLQEERKRPQSPQSSESFFPNGEKVAIDYTRRQINITQVLSDFKNTANAIGAPDDIKQEVNSYLGLIESQSQKDAPNAQIIQANLKNASQILDDYITKTLKKPSKVVENWVDALFLQQIDYKAPVSEALQVEQIPVIAEQEVVPEIVEEDTVDVISVQEPEFFVPEDTRLKSMFIQAKKFAAIDEKERALYSFDNALEYAEELGDLQTAAMVHLEQGKLYDEFDRVEDALYNFNIAAQQSSDNNVKARAHLSMGKIYDEFVKFEPAVDHYVAAVSFAGEADNLKLQTKALSDLTVMHANRYDKQNTLMFANMTDIVSYETESDEVVAFAASRNAQSCEKINEKSKALNYYGISSQAYSSAGDYENLAKNYNKAADLMLGYGNKAKAKKLLSKAFIALQSCDNPELKQEVVSKITSM